ncbi:Nitrite reductase (NAD(P)H) large subunit [mine drainage metagenome]|uniref:Nitrite reductase (NAD(P)H) large subunit n=1 Tax=mine drainage metagenome TaxID=410659 RepID=T1ABK3_9ZZZZ
MAVSGCPRNCAESGIKDVGIIGVDSGYEIYVAGNGGIKTVVAQFLCKVASDDEVTEVVGAFLQLYREQARYLDRTVHWVERIGLDFVKKQVVEDLEQRRTLHERLLFALQGTGDPWMEIAANPSRLQEFEVMSL